MIINCTCCPFLTNIPDTRMVRMPLASSLTSLATLVCYKCSSLKSIPKSLTSLTRLLCYSCPLLMTVPNNNFVYIDKSFCNSLVKVQRKCKKYLQRRREVILTSLIDYLPREVILYCNDDSKAPQKR